MKFTCNIKPMGRFLRIATGALLLLDGIGMFWFDIPGPGIGWRLMQVGIGLFGAFAIFEGIVGWCAIRAMGYKTRI